MFYTYGHQNFSFSLSKMGLVCQAKLLTLIDGIMFTAVCNIVSVLLLQPVHLS